VAQVSKNPEKELEEFLASLPAYKRKELEQGCSSFTQDERNEWVRDLVADNAESAAALQREYLRLVERIPKKVREYREREIRDWVQNMTALSLLPANPEGRPRKDDLADEAALLKKSGLSYAQIAMRLNREHMEGTTTKENIRGLLKARRLKASKTAVTPEKT
jgi:hypothetical protein